ncbi:MAG: alpha/beta hydrolase [Ruthenibacterium sp.]
MQALTCKKTGAKLIYTPLHKQAKGVVIICPGGGYAWRSPREAEPVADVFAQNGWQPVVLEYTVRNAGDAPLGTTPLEELAWAVDTMRHTFADSPVILCGFSAGAHLAASLGVHWDDSRLFAQYPNLRSIRPDAMVLAYPVITAGTYTHADSIKNLAGENDSSYFSLETHVKETTPPTFLWHTVTDELVPVQNSMLFASALLQNHVPMELHLYPTGLHGLSLATPAVDEPEKGRLSDTHVAGWFDACIEWLNWWLTTAVQKGN